MIPSNSTVARVIVGGHCEFQVANIDAIFSAFVDVYLTRENRVVVMRINSSNHKTLDARYSIVMHNWVIRRTPSGNEKGVGSRIRFHSRTVRC